MSGVCPVVKDKQLITYDDTAPARDQFTSSTPDPLFNLCQGGVDETVIVGPRSDGTSIETTTCCTVPGPPGPKGDPGVGVPPGGMAGQILAKIDGDDYNTEWIDAPTGSGDGNVVYRGFWNVGVEYNENDFITHNGSSYVCTVSHLSSMADQPDPTFDFQPGGSYWMLMSTGTDPDTFNEIVDNNSSWFDGVVDWIKDIGNWTANDLALLVFGGAGLYFAGEVVDQLYGYNGGPGEADSTWDGEEGFTGTWTPPTLPQLVSSICEASGLTSYDISDLPDTEVQMTIANQGSARSILETLSLVYSFDMVDSGGTLKFVDRSSNSAAKNLTVVKDLGWTRQNSTLPAPYAVKRYQGTDLPRSVTIKYVSEETAYNTMSQQSTLHTAVTGTDVTVDVPVTLSDQEAYNIAEKALINAHVERTTYAFSTSYEHIDLEPGDVINVDELGDLRIISIEEDRDGGILNFSCTDATFNSHNYTPSGIPAQSSPVYDDQPVVIGFSGGYALELPPLDSSDDSPRLSIVPHGFGLASWPGCAVYVSEDNGTTYDLFASATKEATWGRVSTAMAAAPSTSPWMWDEDTVITVELKTGQLSSVTKAECYAGKNMAMIGRELVLFRNATLIAPNTYELSGFLRGRRGTEVFMNSHQNSELFTLVDDALIEYQYSLTNKNTEVLFKFVTIGSSLDKVDAFAVVPSTASVRPWAPSDLSGGLVGVDWVFNWTGRNHISGDMVDNHPVLNPPGFGGFLVQIINNGSVVRTVGTQIPTFTYTSQQQIEDFGAVQSSITIQVAQLDLDAGSGYITTRSF